MAIKLDNLREEIAPIKKDLLQKSMVQLKQASSPGELADAMDEIDKTLDGIKRKPGRPKKFKNKLTSKQTLLLTKEQKEILDKRRGMNTISEIDLSTFVREWLLRTGCFDLMNNAIKEDPKENLPNLRV